MNLSFLNPFSDKFLMVDPDKSDVRKLSAHTNSYSSGEDAINWNALVRGYGTNNYADGSSYDNNQIVFEAIFSSKRQRINFYRSMALYPFCKKCLSIMADEAVCETAKGEIATLEVDLAYKQYFKESELMSLKEEFDYIINTIFEKDQMWYYYYKWLVDGEIFFEICLNEDQSEIAGLKILPPYCTLGVYDDGLLTGFVQDTKLLTPDSKGEIKHFTKNQIAYMNYGFWGNNRNDVRGHLEPAIRPLNQLRAIEDALTVHVITRAPEKRIFNINTGRMPASKIEEYMQKIKASYRKQLNVDPTTGVITSNNNTQSFTEDFWFSKNSDGNGSTVESFKGSTEFSEFYNYLSPFREQVADALQIPNARWKESEGNLQYNQGIDGLEMQEASFQKLNRRLRKRFSKIIKQVFLVQLQVKGYNKKYLDSAIYNIDLVPATDFEKMRELSMAEKRGTSVGAFSQFLPTLSNSKPDSEEQKPLFSRQFFLEHILGFTQEERIKNDKMIKNESEKLLRESQAAQDEGGEEDEDEMGF